MTRPSARYILEFDNVSEWLYSLRNLRNVGYSLPTNGHEVQRMSSDRVFKIVIGGFFVFMFAGLIAGEFMDEVPFYLDILEFILGIIVFILGIIVFIPNLIIEVLCGTDDSLGKICQ
jgi:cytochrome c biogenesis protein CcdA